MKRSAILRSCLVLSAILAVSFAFPYKISADEYYGYYPEAAHPSMGEAARHELSRKIRAGSHSFLITSI